MSLIRKACPLGTHCGDVNVGGGEGCGGGRKKLMNPMELVEKYVHLQIKTTISHSM